MGCYWLEPRPLKPAPGLPGPPPNTLNPWSRPHNPYPRWGRWWMLRVELRNGQPTPRLSLLPGAAPPPLEQYIETRRAIVPPGPPKAPSWKTSPCGARPDGVDDGPLAPMFSPQECWRPRSPRISVDHGPPLPLGSAGQGPRTFAGDHGRTAPFGAPGRPRPAWPPATNRSFSCRGCPEPSSRPLQSIQQQHEAPPGTAVPPNPRCPGAFLPRSSGAVTAAPSRGHHGPAICPIHQVFRVGQIGAPTPCPARPHSMATVPLPAPLGTP